MSLFANKYATTLGLVTNQERQGWGVADILPWYGVGADGSSLGETAVLISGQNAVWCPTLPPVNSGNTRKAQIDELSQGLMCVKHVTPRSTLFRIY